MLFWLLIAAAPAQDERTPSASVSSGAQLRSLLGDAGFTDVLGPAEQPPPAAPSSQPSPEHHPAPPGAGGHGAPGFALEVRLPSPPAPLSASVAGATFRPLDDGSGEDTRPGDGVWTTMVERYPPDQPLTIQAGDAVLFEGAIVLQQTDGVPRMVIDLTR